MYLLIKNLPQLMLKNIEALLHYKAVPREFKIYRNLHNFRNCRKFSADFGLRRASRDIIAMQIQSKKGCFSV